jgi:two-component system sensor histidine kinase KdpD
MVVIDKEKDTMRQKLKQKMQEWVVFSWRDLSVTIAILFCAMILCVVLRRMDDRGNFASMIFVMAVMVVSRLTTGYLFGVAASFIGVIGVNYAFTYPYFNIDFSPPENIFSALVMLIISFMTSTLTTKLKKWQALKLESEKEFMRANLLRAVSHDLRTPLTVIYGAS